MTLVEVIVASAALSLLILLATSAFADLMRTASSQESLTRTDLVANQALREISAAIRSAVFPVYVERTEKARKNERDVFYDIDSKKWGFGGDNGHEWLENLQSGMDAIAYVHPIDAQGVGDVLDSANHLQIGMVRGDRAYLSATPYGLGDTFVVRNQDKDTEPYEQVSVLTQMAPDTFSSDDMDKTDVTSPSFSWWSGGAQPGVNCFMAIRFAPLLKGGKPLVVAEAGNSGNALVSGRDLDLDGDGEIDGTFQVGRLQLIYSGSEGMPFYYVDGGRVQSETVDQIVASLTPNIVLRRDERDDRTPIFRLVSYDHEQNRGSNAGMPDESKSDGKTAMAVKLLLLDTETVSITESGGISIQKGSRIPSARWYETMIGLKNMER